MKRLWRIFLLAAALVTVLCVSAMAADEPTVAGLYNFQPATGVNLTITPYTAANDTTAIEASNQGTGFANFYQDAVRFDVTYTNTAITAGEQYLLLVCSGEGAPSESNIVYINQAASVAGKVEFTGIDRAYPSSLGKGDYRIFVVGAHSAYTQATPTATFSYYQPYKLGDVDGENGLNSYDASLILQHLVGTYEFVGNGGLAADVDCENGVNSYDASLILQHLVGTYTIPGWEE